MASPFLTITGICCALSTLAEQHAEQEDYGKQAIVLALKEQLAKFTEPVEWIEDLADAKDNPERRDRAISYLTEWAEEWRPKHV